MTLEATPEQEVPQGSEPELQEVENQQQDNEGTQQDGTSPKPDGTSQAGSKGSLQEDPGEDKPVTPEVRSRSNSLETRKQILVKEIEQDATVYDKPEKALTDAFEKRQQKDKEAYNDLIKQNVKLERENRKLSEQVQDYSAQNAVLKVDLQNQQEKCKDLEEQLKTMGAEMKALIKAARKRGINTDFEKEDENNNLEVNPDDPPEVRKRKAQEKRIRDLQFRLLRMTTDMEEKDQRIAGMERDQMEKELLVEEYERVMDAEKVGEIRSRVCQERKDGSNMEQRANVVKQAGGAKNSAICVIM